MRDNTTRFLQLPRGNELISSEFYSPFLSHTKIILTISKSFRASYWFSVSRPDNIEIASYCLERMFVSSVHWQFPWKQCAVKSNRICVSRLPTVNLTPFYWHSFGSCIFIAHLCTRGWAKDADDIAYIVTLWKIWKFAKIQQMKPMHVKQTPVCTADAEYTP